MGGVDGRWLVEGEVEGKKEGVKNRGEGGDKGVGEGVGTGMKKEGGIGEGVVGADGREFLVSESDRWRYGSGVGREKVCGGEWVGEIMG